MVCIFCLTRGQKFFHKISILIHFCIDMTSSCLILFNLDIFVYQPIQVANLDIGLVIITSVFASNGSVMETMIVKIIAMKLHQSVSQVKKKFVAKTNSNANQVQLVQ